MPKLFSVRFEIGETLGEFTVALTALTRFQAGVQRAQPGFLLPGGTQPHHLEQAVEKLEGTYLIRMWAVFEAAWVSFWRHRTGNLGTIKAMNLIQWAEGVQAGHKAADDVTNDVNRVPPVPKLPGPRRPPGASSVDRERQDVPQQTSGQTPRPVARERRQLSVRSQSDERSCPELNFCSSDSSR